MKCNKAPLDPDLPSDVVHLARTLSDELKRCADILLETQEHVSDIAPFIKSARAVTGLQRLDFATQSVTSLGHILSAFAEATQSGGQLLPEHVSDRQILEEISQRVWRDKETPLNSRQDSSGAIDWL